MDSLERHDDYTRGRLDAADLLADPVAQFARWLGDAEAAGVAEPNAMVLSTVDGSGPTSRTVLLKGLHDGCFELVTNAGSRKGRAMTADGRVSLLFPWYPLQRQVLVDGDAAPAPDAMSDEYWASRPRGSQLGAWASRQSAPLPDRAELEARVAEADARFPGDVPRPSFWGAWLVTPRRVELWQGRASRLHDRLVYTRDGAGWRIDRLQP
ncbi:pyridoxamine 5'-phosphate oxidase [Amnibacterium endophyticum]|uniref:Pyridoxine/pyridoxamine 5'-phosphate oxidase n=1 Tax=Amnibacterium endophyticum TaxID=2109337 RepID=A0ABW4LJ11_9MICO